MPERRRIRSWTPCFLWLPWLCLACGGSKGPPARNAILVSLDTLRADHLGCYGYSRETSPHIDALAKQGVLFERAVAQSTSTLPSHRSLFQSRPPSETGRRAPSLAQVLARSGFRTAAFTGGGNVAAKLGLDAGFEIYEEFPDGLVDGFPRMEGWLRANGEKPFFLFLHTYDIHLPYDPPPPYDALFYPEYRGPVTGSGTRQLLRRIRGLPSQASQTDAITDDDRKKVVALYDGGIRYVDEFMGRLAALLDELGLAESTVLAILSDHGEEFWDHGSVIHAHALYEEQIRVPLIWRVPAKGFAGRRVKGVVRLMDVAPTLLELLGVEPSREFTGESLLPMMKGSETSPRPALSEIRLKKSWTSFPWKLHTDGKTNEVRLFHLESDPGETVDLGDANPDVVRSLWSEARAYLKGKASTDILELDPGIEDEALLKQLRALGYIE